MIESLTRKPLIRAAVARGRLLFERLSDRIGGGGRTGLALKLFTGFYLAALVWVFHGTVASYAKASDAVAGTPPGELLAAIPSVAPLIWRGVAALLAFAAFVACLFLKEGLRAEQGRERLVVSVLWLVAGAALAAWLPSDFIATREAMAGKALAGETPSIPAYFGMLLVVSALILSIPVAAMCYFRLGLMDRYVVDSFLSPFFFCLCSFVAIFVIGDLTDNGSLFIGLPVAEVFAFYASQLPFVLVFVMPIAVLLSGLFTLSKMSKSNEFISMVGSGRSVWRILAPLFAVGFHATLICVALKYEWAPSAAGYKEAVVQAGKEREWYANQGSERPEALWAKRGWMHVNEVDQRTWFVGRVPFDLSKEMGDVVVWQLDDESRPVEIVVARGAQWRVATEAARWEFSDLKVYRYGEDGIPEIEVRDTLVIEDWAETPWMVLSSSQDPEFLGLPGLAMYLNAHSELDEKSLAPFRTNWWYVFAEPFLCLALLMVAAPLGINYSRRSSMAGVTGAIIIFALMYLMRGTTLALGHGGFVSPFVAAWSTNFAVAGLGLFLLWFRARNREIPRFRDCLRPRRQRPAGRAARVASAA